MAKTQTQVEVSTGIIIGSTENQISRFLGIPFAEPPYGPNRFQPPKPAEPWQEPLLCDSFAATAPQSPYPGRLGEILGSVKIPGENLLCLNVWAPENAKDLPVVVWFHGGAFERGATALDIYDGSTFARDGVIFVSVAYRLGSEGFSVLPDAQTNLGLEDAAAGLGWVFREIAAFGGDRERITIMGESAGGQLVGAILSRPEGRVAAAGAIIQSGPLGAQKRAKSRRVTRALAKKLRVRATRKSFLRVDPYELVRARDEQMCGKTILDGVPSFVLTRGNNSMPEIPAVAVVEAKIPILIGFNTEEFRLWFAPDALKKVTVFKTWLVRRVLGISKKVVARVRESNPGASPGEILGFLLTEKVFRGPALEAATKRAAKRAVQRASQPISQNAAPTFVYEFSWGTKNQKLGASHALELGFTFDALNSDGAKRMAPDAPQELADRMHKDWVEFIKTGKPSWGEYASESDVHVYDAAEG